MTPPWRIAVVAGDPSGDDLAAQVLEALAHLGGVELRGLGGPALAARGLRGVGAGAAVMGGVEVVAARRTLGPLYRDLRALIASGWPEMLLAVDYGGMNLPLALEARSRHIPVLWYVPPKVWAWGRWRIPLLRRAADECLTLFPFEATFLTRVGVRARCVGHPALDRAASLRAQHPPDQRGAPPRLVLMPGSRPQEVQALLPDLLHAAALLHEQVGPLRVVLPVASGLNAAVIEEEVRRTGVPVELTHAGAMDALSGAHLALVKSGTGTLEAALMGVPHVVVYRMAPTSWRLARRLVRHVSYVGLPNLLLGEELLPERLQDFDGVELARTALELWEEGPRRRRVIQGLRRVRDTLGPAGAAERTAQILREALASARAREGSR